MNILFTFILVTTVDAAKSGTMMNLVAYILVVVLVPILGVLSGVCVFLSYVGKVTRENS